MYKIYMSITYHLDQKYSSYGLLNICSQISFNFHGFFHFVIHDDRYAVNTVPIFTFVQTPNREFFSAKVIFL
jgi:hypothetical protein